MKLAFALFAVLCFGSFTAQGAVVIVQPSTQVVATTFGLGGWTAKAGQNAYFTITRKSGSASATLSFVTSDGTAKSGTDYQAKAMSVYIAQGVNSQVVAVPTYVDKNAYGKTLSFGAGIYMNGVVMSTAGSFIVEPAAPAPSPSPSPSSSLTVSPTPSPSASSDPYLALTTTNPGGGDTIGGLPAIPSEFDYHLGMEPMSMPASNTGDVVGAFRFLCGSGQVLPDDPIVFPGQPGRSHLHQFYGNVGANGYSTYESLRRTGLSTCSGGNNYPLNRSAYWMPAMLDGVGHVVQPDWVAVYYKRRPQSDPVVSDPTYPTYMGKAVAMPNGMRFIMGFNMATGTPSSGAYWNCTGPTAVGGHYATLGEALQHCPSTPTLKNGVLVYNQLLTEFDGPTCWDGVRLDSADHHSHLQYPSYGNWGYAKCPSGYPYVIPFFHLAAAYTVDSNLATWHLSSDEMFPNLAPGSTLHADFFDAWDNEAMKMWTFQGCIDDFLNCVAGNMGNGYAILDEGKAPADYFNGVFTHSWLNQHRLIPVP